MSETSASLLDRLREQPDEESWRRLADIHTPLVRGWLRLHAAPVPDIEDLVQEVPFVVIHEVATSSN